MALWLIEPRLALAHDFAVETRRWTLTPWLWTGLATSVVLYARGHYVLQSRLGAPLRNGGLRAVWFTLAIATLVIALLSPLDALSDQLFAAHMVQHELLMLVAAPLLVLARPLELYFWALPQSTRAKTLAIIRRPTFRSLFAAMTAPGVALLVHGIVRWGWHIPALFEACLRNELIHGVQHATFFFTAVLFWWALLQGMHGRYGYGVATVFVFATAMHTGALGALITFARSPWYPGQTHGADPLWDQQLAGFIMWIVAGMWLTGLGLALFVAWLGHASRARQMHRFSTN
jgi:cytochrome c oxidase assembly factor CtaG